MVKYIKEKTRAGPSVCVSPNHVLHSVRPVGKGGGYGREKTEWF